MLSWERLKLHRTCHAFSSLGPNLAIVISKEESSEPFFLHLCQLGEFVHRLKGLKDRGTPRISQIPHRTFFFFISSISSLKTKNAADCSVDFRGRGDWGGGSARVEQS